MALCRSPIRRPVMICAPAAERPASVGEHGRKAESVARTAQMITPRRPNSESVPSDSEHSLPASQPHPHQASDLDSRWNFHSINVVRGSFNTAF